MTYVLFVHILLPYDMTQLQVELKSSEKARSSVGLILHTGIGLITTYIGYMAYWDIFAMLLTNFKCKRIYFRPYLTTLTLSLICTYSIPVRYHTASSGKGLISDPFIPYELSSSAGTEFNPYVLIVHMIP